MNTKLVYVAGPYTNPDPCENTHAAIRAGDSLYEDFHHELVPVIPHLSMLWHMVVPHTDVDFWYEYDLELLARCDVCLRLPGASSGADGEVEFAMRHAIPVVYNRLQLERWHDETRARESLPS